MVGEEDVEEVKTELATAVGLVALSNASLHEAAERAGVSQWELEECLDSTSLAEPLGIELDADVSDEIDRLFDERYS